MLTNLYGFVIGSRFLSQTPSFPSNGNGTAEPQHNARPFGMRLTSSNANIASLVRISPTKFRLLARRKGTIKIQLIDECLSTKRQQWSSFAPQIVQEKTVQVI